MNSNCSTCANKALSVESQVCQDCLKAPAGYPNWQPLVFTDNGEQRLLDSREPGAMVEYVPVGKVVFADNAADIEHLLAHDAEHLNCPACGGSGHVEDMLGVEAQRFIDLCARYGKVPTIEQRPLQPLAMGNYETVVSFRGAR